MGPANKTETNPVKKLLLRKRSMPGAILKRTGTAHPMDFSIISSREHEKSNKKFHKELVHRRKVLESLGVFNWNLGRDNIEQAIRVTNFWLRLRTVNSAEVTELQWQLDGTNDGIQGLEERYGSINDAEVDNDEDQGSNNLLERHHGPMNEAKDIDKHHGRKGPLDECHGSLSQLQENYCSKNQFKENASPKSRFGKHPGSKGHLEEYQGPKVHLERDQRSRSHGGYSQAVSSTDFSDFGNQTENARAPRMAVAPLHHVSERVYEWTGALEEPSVSEEESRWEDFLRGVSYGLENVRFDRDRRRSVGPASVPPNSPQEDGGDSSPISLVKPVPLAEEQLRTERMKQYLRNATASEMRLESQPPINQPSPRN